MAESNGPKAIGFDMKNGGMVKMKNSPVYNVAATIQVNKKESTPQFNEEEATKGFLKKLETELKNPTENDVLSAFKKLNKVDVHIPLEMVVVDLNRGYEKTSQDPVVKETEREIKLSCLHGNLQGQNPDHVMLLGEVGEGKTTTAKEYALNVAEGKAELMQIKCVLFIKMAELADAKTTAFDLIVSRLIRLDENEKRAGRNWLRKHAMEMLLVLDGLDQSQVDLSRDYSVIKDESIEESASVLLANLMSGALYPGMKILSTTREDTYWKLPKKVRPTRTVVLKRFSKENVFRMVKKFAGEVDGEKINEHLKTKTPNLLTLCGNPLFLIYTVQVFKQNMQDPPDTFAGLMCAVIKYFEASDNFYSSTDINARYSKFDDLSKLAFRGMIDHRFEFGVKYFNRLGINPFTLSGPISSRIETLPHQSNPGVGDQKWSFLHQSIQEILAAVHMFDLSKTDLETYVAGKLNDSEFMVVRRVFYGMVMNKKSQKYARPFVGDAAWSIKDCEEILMKQLESCIDIEGAITSTKFTSLLQECGAGVIARLKAKIYRVIIPDSYLRSDDVDALISFMKQCLPLTEAQIQSLTPTPDSLQIFNNFICDVTKVEVTHMYIEKDIRIRDCGTLMELLGKIPTTRLMLQGTDEVVQYLLRMWTKNKKAPCDTLGFVNKNFSNNTLMILGQFMSVVKVKCIYFSSCGLTEEKLGFLNQNLTESAKLEEMYITDDSEMDLYSYHSLAGTVGKTRVNTLTFARNGLTQERLQAFGDVCEQKKIKLNAMRIWEDSGMNLNAYRSLAATVKKASVHFLTFKENKLEKEKLQAFGKNCKQEKVQLFQLSVSDNTMDLSAFQELAITAERSNTHGLTVLDCNMTAEKFRVIGESAQKNGVKFSVFGIHYDKTMTDDCYPQLANLCVQACVDCLQFLECDITTQRLTLLGKEIAEINQDLKIQTFFLQKEDLLETSSIKPLADIMASTALKNIHLRDCNLSKEKLDALCTQLERRKLKLSNVFLDQYGFQPSNGEIAAVCRLRKFVTDVLSIQGWEMELKNIEKLQEAVNDVPYQSAKTRLTYKGTRILLERVASDAEIETQLAILLQELMIQDGKDSEKIELTTAQHGFEMKNIFQLLIKPWLGLLHDTVLEIPQNWLGAAICLFGAVLFSSAVYYASLRHDTVLEIPQNWLGAAICLFGAVLFSSAVYYARRKKPAIDGGRTDLKELKSRIVDGSIQSMQSISLLSKSDAIAQLKLYIHQVIISDGNLRPREEHTLMKFLHQCLPLTEARIQRLTATPASIFLLREFIGSVDQFKVSNVTVGNCIRRQHCKELTLLLGGIHAISLTFEGTNEVFQDLLNLWIGGRKAPCKRFILNGKFSKETFRILGRFLTIVGVTSLDFWKCGLGEADIEILNQNLAPSAKLNILVLGNNVDMDSDTYRVLAKTVAKASVKVVKFESNGLTTDKLSTFGQEFSQQKNIKIQTLFIQREHLLSLSSMEPLVDIIVITGLRNLLLTECNLTAEKINALFSQMEQREVKLATCKLNHHGFEPSKREIKAVCQLQKMTTEILSIVGWKVQDGDVEKLQESLNEVSHPSLQTWLTRGGRKDILVKKTTSELTV